MAKWSRRLRLGTDRRGYFGCRCKRRVNGRRKVGLVRIFRLRVNWFPLEKKIAVAKIDDKYTYRTARCLAFSALLWTFSLRSLVTTLVVVVVAAAAVVVFLALAVAAVVPVGVSFFLVEADASFGSFFGAISKNENLKETILNRISDFPFSNGWERVKKWKEPFRIVYGVSLCNRFSLAYDSIEFSKRFFFLIHHQHIFIWMIAEEFSPKKRFPRIIEVASSANGLFITISCLNCNLLGSVSIGYDGIQMKMSISISLNEKYFSNYISFSLSTSDRIIVMIFLFIRFFFFSKVIRLF